MGLVPESHFQYLGPDKLGIEISDYLVPDIQNSSLGLVPETYFGYLGPDKLGIEVNDY